MSSIRERIIDAVHTALNTDRPEGIPETVRTRIVSPDADDLPAITLYQEGEGVTPKNEEREGMWGRDVIVNRAVTFNVEVLVKAGTGDPPADQAADPYLVWATQAIVGAGRFDNLSMFCADEMGTKFSYEQENYAFCRATMTWKVKYKSRTDDPEHLS